MNATNLLDQLSREYDGGVVSTISKALGEDTARTQTAVSGALPALLGGLVTKGSTTEGAAGLIDLLRKNNFDGSRFTDVAGAVSQPNGLSSLMQLGGPLLGSIFGGRTDTVTDWLATQSGIKKSSASSLLSLALPTVLGFIARQLSAGGTWSASSLMSLLAGQKSFLQSAQPGLAGILGFGGPAGYEPAAPRAAAARTAEAEPVRGGAAWWKWALPLLLLGALLLYFLTRETGPERAVVVQPTPTLRVEVSPTVAPAVSAALGAFVEKKLPNGTVLKIPSNGVESKLLAFIEDPTKKVDRETWFTFDRIEFDTDSARLRPSSQEQLRNIHEILKAYPQVNLKIGGYTDNVGDDARNLKLSGERATNTMNEIVKLGPAASRLAAEGYGEKHPVADNATEDGRQRNRRIDVRVTKK